MLKQELRCLTGLRFVLALWVLAFHAATFLPNHLANIPILRGVNVGYLAVSGFFVLSGFILAYNYGDRLETRTQRLYFWRARLARIYPVYLLALVAWAPVAATWIHEGVQPLGLSLAAGVFSLLLLQSWIPPLAMLWNAPAWSLSTEAFFYAVLPTFAARLRRWSVRSLWALGLGCGVLAMLLTVVVNHYMDGAAFIALEINTPMTWAAMGYVVNPLARLPEFVAGYCLGLIFTQARPWPRQWSGVIAVAAGAAIIALANYLPPEKRYVGAATLLFMALIYGLANAPKWLQAVLGNPVSEFFGETSYAFYLLHIPISYVMKGLFRSSQVWNEHPLAIFAIYVGVTQLAASGAFIFIERPMRRRIMRQKT